MKSDVLKILQELNFTEYEAKAYLALLEKSPLSGYAVSLNSGVPRSKIYEVLGGMVNRGDIMISQEKTPLYIPLPPEDLIFHRKHKAQQIFDSAQTALKKYSQSAKIREGIWSITGHQTIINRVKEGIKGAKQRVLLEIWKEDAEELRDTLQQAANRGVEILIVTYGDVDFDFARVYPHDMSERITLECGGRWIVFSADDHEVVAGILSLGEDSRAAWTMHPGLIMPITELIIHDMYIMEIMNVFRKELESKFGPDLIELRKKFMMPPKDRKHYHTEFNE